MVAIGSTPQFAGNSQAGWVKKGLIAILALGAATEATGFNLRGGVPLDSDGFYKTRKLLNDNPATPPSTLNETAPAHNADFGFNTTEAPTAKPFNATTAWPSKSQPPKQPSETVLAQRPKPPENQEPGKNGTDPNNGIKHPIAQPANPDKKKEVGDHPGFIAGGCILAVTLLVSGVRLAFNYSR